MCLLIWDIGVPLIWLMFWLHEKYVEKRSKITPASSMFYDAEWINNIKL